MFANQIKVCGKTRRDPYCCLLTMLSLVYWFSPSHLLVGHWAPGASRIAIYPSPIHAWMDRIVYPHSNTK